MHVHNTYLLYIFRSLRLYGYNTHVLDVKELVCAFGRCAKMKIYSFFKYYTGDKKGPTFFYHLIIIFSGKEKLFRRDSYEWDRANNYSKVENCLKFCWFVNKIFSHFLLSTTVWYFKQKCF